jgi:septal ring factor EnvC (AmiA/AmiB activator)
VRERATRRRKLEKTIQEAEERIARLEAEQQALVDDLESADSNLSFSEINQRLTYLPAQIATETEAWESAAKELEELNS